MKKNPNDQPFQFTISDFKAAKTDILLRNKMISQAWSVWQNIVKRVQANADEDLIASAVEHMINQFDKFDPETDEQSVNRRFVAYSNTVITRFMINGTRKKKEPLDYSVSLISEDDGRQRLTLRKDGAVAVSISNTEHAACLTTTALFSDGTEQINDIVENMTGQINCIWQNLTPIEQEVWTKRVDGWSWSDIGRDIKKSRTEVRLIYINLQKRQQLARSSQ